MILDKQADRKMSSPDNFPPPSSNHTTPEVMLATFIVGCLVSQMIIPVKLDAPEGFDDIELGIKLIAQILEENKVITDDEFWIRNPYKQKDE